MAISREAGATAQKQDLHHLAAREASTYLASSSSFLLAQASRILLYRYYSVQKCPVAIFILVLFRSYDNRIQ